MARLIMEDFLTMKYVAPVAELISVESVNVLCVSPEVIPCVANSVLPEPPCQVD